MTFTTFKCEFCKAELKTKSSFNHHQRVNKKCIKIQEQKNDINISNIFTCEFCDKNFTTKQYQNKHYEICKINKINKDNIQKDILLKNKDISLKEKDNLLKEKENALKDKEEHILKLEEQIKELQNNIKDIAIKSVSTPKTMNTMNTINQNKYLFLTPFNLTKEEIKEKIEKNFTKDHFMNGQKGVADFTYNNLLLDENKQLNYFCSDTSRKYFCYKDINGEIKKDIKTKMLTNFIADDIIIKSNNICDTALADKNIKI
jgi:lipopolysaccharide biosynthesis regulator YciM